MPSTEGRVPRPLRVLIVDDHRDIFRDASRIFESPSPVGCEASFAQNGEEALDACRNALGSAMPFSMVLVDWHLPGRWDGLETIRQLRKLQPALWVVLTTGAHTGGWPDPQDVGLGRQRWLYLRKPFVPQELRQIIHVAQETLARPSAQPAQSVSLSNEPITNRWSLERALMPILDAARSRGVGALMHVDVDYFHAHAGRHGAGGAHALVQHVGELIRARVGPACRILQVGVDEFAVVLGDYDRSQATALAEEIRDLAATRPFTWRGEEANVVLSLGIAPFATSPGQAREVINAAEIACAAAREHGGDRVCEYSSDDPAMLRLKQASEARPDVERAITKGEFELYAQPILPRAGSVALPGAEVLLRWRQGNGLQAPGAFLPTIERFGLASRLDRWVVGAVLRWLSEHLHQIDHLGFISVNLSGQTLSHPPTMQWIERHLAEARIPLNKLHFEVTETAVVRNLGPASEFMHRLKEMGVGFALDDFGAGFSSFIYLHELPVSMLKIDGAFARDCARDPRKLEMIRAMSEIGQRLGKTSLAEFIEDARTRDMVESVGIDFMQGYFFGKPAPIARLLPGEPATTRAPVLEFSRA